MVKAKKRRSSKAKPKGFFLGGGITDTFKRAHDPLNIFGWNPGPEPEFKQPRYVKKLQNPFIRTIKNELKRPDEETVAEFSDDTETAFGLTRDLATEDPTGYGDAMTFSKGVITSAFDPNEPWDEKLVQATLADYDRAVEMDRARADREQAGRGAFGDRAYVADREADRVATNDRSILAGNLRETGIDRRTKAAGALAGLAGQERTEAFRGAQMLGMSGQRQEDREQEVLDVPYRRTAAMTPIFGQAPSTVYQPEDPSKNAAAAGLMAASYFWKDGGEVKGYADGGAFPRVGSLSPDVIERAKAGDEEALAQVREAMKYRSGDALKDDRSVAERSVLPISALEDPRMKAAEGRRRDLGEGDTGDGFTEWWKRNFNEARDAVRGPRAEAAEPEAAEGAFTLKPAPRPKRAAASLPSRAAACFPTPTPSRGVGAFDQAPIPAARPDPQPTDILQTDEWRERLGNFVQAQNSAAPFEAPATDAAEDQGAFARWMDNPLTHMAFGILASDRPTLGGAFGEGAMGAVNMMQQRRDTEATQDLAEEEQRRRGAFDDWRRSRAETEDRQWQKSFDQEQEAAAAREALDRDRLALQERETDARLAALQSGRTWSGGTPRGQVARNPFQVALEEALAAAIADPLTPQEDIDMLIERLGLYGAFPGAGGEVPPLPARFELVSQ